LDLKKSEVLNRSIQVLESAFDQDDADGNVKRRSLDASIEAIGDESNVTCLNGPRRIVFKSCNHLKG
jgi:hypothetical protein